jgi:hypothetical protein
MRPNPIDKSALIASLVGTEHAGVNLPRAHAPHCGRHEVEDLGPLGTIDVHVFEDLAN